MKKVIRVLMAALFVAAMIPTVAFADTGKMEPIADETEYVNVIAETLEAGLELYAAEAEEIKMTDYNWDVALNGICSAYTPYGFV